MSQCHRNETPRIARMLRDLRGAKTAQNGTDVAKPATDRGGHPRKLTAKRWFKVAAFVIAAVFVAVVAWQASTDVEHQFANSVQRSSSVPQP